MDVQRTIQRETEAAKGILAAMAVDDDDLVIGTVEGETQLVEAIAKALDEIDECDVITSGLAAKIQAFSARKASTEARSQRLRAAIEQAMAILDLKTVRLPTATITLRAVNPGLEVVEEADIPSAYWTPSAPKLDRKALKDALDSGHDIPGARLNNGGVSLTIRRS
jgi:hypothetical protein